MTKDSTATIGYRYRAISTKQFIEEKIKRDWTLRESTCAKIKVM